jgi:hypothetical protein
VRLAYSTLRPLAEEGLDKSVILEFKSTIEFLDSFGNICGFPEHEVVDVYREEDPSIDRVEGALICLTCLEAEIQNQLASRISWQRTMSQICDACLRP